MNKFLVLAIVLAGVFYFFQKQNINMGVSNPIISTNASEIVSAPAPSTSSYSCDGRTHCSQMSSCAEAKYFIQHCPNTQMDGNNDGVPCEKQWCR
jgi:hypothetical protein